MALRLITAPAEEPVSLAEAKAFLGVTGTAEDGKISLLISAARQHLDGPAGILGRALVTQTWELVLDAFPAREIELPLPPVQSVTSVKYDDVDGVEQTVPSTDYTVDTATPPGWVIPDNSWPATISASNSVRVRFVAGYGAAAAVPAPIRQAILLMVGHYYAQGKASGSTAGGVQEITFGERRVRYFQASESTKAASSGAMPLAAESLIGPYVRHNI